MISSYGRYGFGEEALQLFLLSMREGFKPTEFTLSSVLSCIPILQAEYGSQAHSLAIKSCLESDTIVASSLMEMYTKVGSIDSAMEIFVNLDIRDLISWNTILMGLSLNGRVAMTLNLFEELLKEGPSPDRITLAAVLLSCNYGGFVDAGMVIFSSMEEVSGVKPSDEHYTYVIDLLCRAGKLEEAINITRTMPYEPNSSIWESILCSCAIHGDLKLTENVAERMIELQPQPSLPYLLLAQAYEMRGKWEAVVRVKKAMKQRGIKKVSECSWIGIKNRVYTFKSDQLQHHGGTETYVVLKLLTWEIEDEDFVCSQHDKLDSES